jgi:spermidine synthase
MALTVHEPHREGLSMLIELDRVLLHERTAFQDMLIADTVGYGRALFLDGLIQSAEVDEALYHEPFVHPALVTQGNPRRVLVAGAGEGATKREVLRHPTVEYVLTVDLDQRVVEACKEHMPEWHAGAYDDPRVELRFEDVQKTLDDADAGSFDAVFLDVTDPVFEGPASDLFTAKFYRKVERVLTDDGIVVLQAGEIDPVDARIARTVRSTMKAVFPWLEFGHSYVPSFHSLWGFALAAKRPMDFHPADLEQRIRRLPTDSLQVYDAHFHRGFCRIPKLLADKLNVPGDVITGEGEERLVAYSFKG